MSYHDKNVPSASSQDEQNTKGQVQPDSQTKTNAQGQVAPEGYHYISDGTLMADSKMADSETTGNVMPMTDPCCNMDDFVNNAENTVKPIYKTLSNGYTSYHTFIQNMWNHFHGMLPGATGCAWWADRVTWWVWQMNNQNLTLPQFQLKMAKINFAQAMHTACCCPGPVPQIANPDPQNNKQWSEKFKGSIFGTKE